MTNPLRKLFGRRASDDDDEAYATVPIRPTPEGYQPELEREEALLHDRMVRLRYLQAKHAVIRRDKL